MQHSNKKIVGRVHAMSLNVMLLAQELGRLKRIPRTGWALRGVPGPESVADHSYRTTVLAMVLGDRLGLDTDRMMRMALLHELSECRTGDIPSGAIPIEQKTAIEQRVARDLLAAAGDDGVYQELIEDFLEGRSREARLVRDLDRLEMLLQALEYQDAGFPVFEEFYTNTIESIREPEVRALAEALR